MKHARLVIISGPSGAGKGTLVARARQIRPDLALAISATTRQPRNNEKDRTHYQFLTEEAFDDLLEKGGFLEWASVHGHRYGTPYAEVEKNLSSGNTLILEIDPQGAFQVKKKLEDAVLIFITTPSEHELEERLRARGTETEEEVLLRLYNMRSETEASKFYDAIIVNDEVERATQELLDVIAHYENLDA